MKLKVKEALRLEEDESSGDSGDDVLVDAPAAAAAVTAAGKYCICGMIKVHVGSCLDYVKCMHNLGVAVARKQSVCAYSKDWRWHARVTPVRSPCGLASRALHVCGSLRMFCARCCHSSRNVHWQPLAYAHLPFLRHSMPARVPHTGMGYWYICFCCGDCILVPAILSPFLL